MSCFIQLQAGMALGLFLLILLFFLICILLPALIILFFRREISTKKVTVPLPATKDYIFAFLQALLYAVSVVIIVAVLLWIGIDYVMKDAIL